MVVAALLVHVEDPHRDADVGGDEKLPRQYDDRFDPVLFDEPLPDYGSGPVAVTQRAVGEQKSRHSAARPQVGKHVQYPCVVGVALRRDGEIRPPRIILQMDVVPVLEVEWRIRHDVVEVQSLVDVVLEGVLRFAPQVVAESAQRQIHLRQPPGGGFFFLTVDVHPADISLPRLDKFGTLDEHAARTAAGVVKRPVKRFDHGGDELDNVMRRIILALFLGRVDGELFQEVFVDVADQITMLAEPLVGDLVDLVHHFFDVVGRQIAGGECSLDETALQLRNIGGDLFQRRVQRHIQIRSRSIDERPPPRLRRQRISPVGKGGVLEKGGENIRIVGVQPLGNQFFPKLHYAVFIFLADEAQKNQRQHQIPFLEERTGIFRLAKNIPAFEQYVIQPDFFLFRTLRCSRHISVSSFFPMSFAVYNPTIIYRQRRIFQS